MTPTEFPLPCLCFYSRNCISPLDSHYRRISNSFFSYRNLARNCDCNLGLADALNNDHVERLISCDRQMTPIRRQSSARSDDANHWSGVGMTGSEGRVAASFARSCLS
jgi:hypothetical protein